MVLYNFYLYNRHGVCLYYEEWNRKKAPEGSHEDDQKRMYGLLFAMKSFCIKSSPEPVDGFRYFTTSTYRLHFYETPTGLKFVLLSDPKTKDLREELKKIYSTIYVEYVVKNPLYKVNEPIKCELFVQAFQKFIKALPCFN